MRCRVAALLVVAGCGRVQFDAASDATPLPSPLAWWKLDETSGTTAADSSGNGENGSVVGGAAWVAGKIGNGIALNGTSQYVRVPDSPTLRLAGSWTIATWVSLTAVPPNLGMYTLLAKTDANGNETYSLRVDNNYGQFGATAPGSFVAQFAAANSTDVFAVSTPPSIAVARWYWLAGSWDATTGTLALYIDGQLAATTTNGAVVPTSLAGQDLLIGDNAGHLGQDTAGILDDVRIYDRALAAGELAALYAALILR